MERRGNHLSKVSKTDPKNYTFGVKEARRRTALPETKKKRNKFGTMKEKSW